VSTKRVLVFDFTEEEPGQRRVNVGSERFHEGRGAGKSTTPGGREKHAYFLEMRPEPAFKALGASVRTSKDADCWDGTNLVLSSSISFKVNLLTLMGRS